MNKAIFSIPGGPSRPFHQGFVFTWQHPAENVPLWGCLPEDWLGKLPSREFASCEEAMVAAEEAFLLLPPWRQKEILSSGEGELIWIPRLDRGVVRYEFGCS
jgi:hypothetical protein